MDEVLQNDDGEDPYKGDQNTAIHTVVESNAS